MILDSSSLTINEYNVQRKYLRTLNSKEKRNYKNNSLMYKRTVLNNYNGEPIEYLAYPSELRAEDEYLLTLSYSEKKAYRKKSSFEQHEIIQNYIEAKKPKASQSDEEPEPLVENEENVANETTIIKEIPEPEVYDFDDIQSRINSVRISEINKVLSPGEIKIVEALEVIQNNKDAVEEVLEELQRKNPTKKITYDYEEIEPNYYNQQFFDRIDEIYKGVDYDSLALPEKLELDAESSYEEREILISQPTKATPKKSAPTKKDTKLVEYVRSVEESLNNGVIDSDYAKQAIINYLEENL
ncbi:hypothetical protein [Staphylococcus arlettae]|uniref:hypothetical protein n=1 Tax=Staphylococcus arlettae TaxID=29378 RepID=UPI001E35D972|nr:hypothetical protein [Staphylococcus arlettae]MCD8838600.1 hypothetical protein [Staphylococcus arlettae]MCD8866331.1 hypothetical protein [Staphylococcus arlettae]